jgi:cytochrome c peroxidase
VVRSWAWVGLALPAHLLACSADDIPTLTGKYSQGAKGQAPSQEALVALGRKIFFDPGLSASGQQSCATCHSPAACA